MCWGFGAFGQLGDGNPQNRPAPVDVVGLEGDVVSVASGQYHTCALTEAGGAKCWGSNTLGQLGTTDVMCFYPDGSSIACSAEPLDVVGLEDGVAAISPGNFHTCVLTEAGGVKCWGDNSVGQLGDGTTTSRLEPADVLGLTSGVMAVEAGFDHTCALTLLGAVKCWGDNRVSELGAESTETCTSVFGDAHACSTTPLDVETLDGGITALSALGSFTCALTETGGVTCWGNNAHGQLGDGTFANIRRTPSDVCADEQCEAPLTGASTVAAGGSHTCALMNSGDLKCWGFGAFGQVGDGDLDINDRTTPVDVCQVYDTESQQCAESLSGAIAVAAGQRYTCAVTEAGGVKCWGANGTGVLGIGVFGGDVNPLPLDVVGLDPKPPPTETATITPTATPTPSPTATPTPSPTPTPEVLLGDVNCDGTLTSVDALLILQRVARLLQTLPCLEDGDIDEDGAITALDAVLILQHSAGLLTSA